MNTFIELTDINGDLVSFSVDNIILVVNDLAKPERPDGDLAVIFVRGKDRGVFVKESYADVLVAIENSSYIPSPYYTEPDTSLTSL